MQLFFNPEITEETTEIIFNKEESRHIVKVLRKESGDEVVITNGKGIVFTAIITIPSDKKCVAKITTTEKKPKEWNYHLHVAIAPTKNMDRLEWFVEKATEIGIDEITPIICHNSERKVVKIDRLHKIMLAAMKQSLKFNAVKINPVIKFSEFIDQEFSGNKFIAHCHDSEKKSLKNIDKFSSEILILIGPEGDFSEQEVALANTSTFTPISLGNSRLRTETAALTAVQHISFLHY
ncbi:16S rRNA (uracil(1498)-N(3))-methyltransferase [Tenacibaculum jejuense]|uniref:Ribosomal RNA small subunit methyltransferase E n=1 Tax=Tenacibaculum jejuense TaxID=584609 RepID=A0A238U890_9FLAO|nr:16S rRNA (uracil(1498)-N(3))-methyltransferase [Tenacibaculum jejuense]SNR15206.1 Ribosomal RNA small subunit methyltransferase E [Tenacibaculum jejuense]